MMELLVPVGPPKLHRANRALAAALAAVLAVSSPLSLADTPSRSPKLDTEISKLVDLYSDGLSYDRLQWRHVVNGPLFDDDRPAAVVFFTLAGVGLTNGYREYMAIFARGEGRDLSKVGGPKERPFHLVATGQVGGKWSRTLDWQTARISRGSIVVKGKRWSKDDPGCCPGMPIEVTFAVSPDLPSEPFIGPFPVLRESEQRAQTSHIQGSQIADWRLSRDDDGYHLVLASAETTSIDLTTIGPGVDLERVEIVKQAPQLALVEYRAGTAGTSDPATAYRAVIYNLKTQTILGDAPLRVKLGSGRVEQSQWTWSEGTLKVEDDNYGTAEFRF